MDSSGASPISLTADSCSANEGRCHIATPAPPTPFPYSPMSPYGAINPFSFMSRYSSAGAAHLQSAFSSPLASSLPPALAYPTDIYHYNPYSALTPTSPLTPSSFWSLTAQQSYHQLNGITFGPSGPVSYNTNAHLFNIFSPNSLSPMSPSPDLHSPSLYPRVSSMPSPYASSPGLSSAFMSPSSMPLLLSPSLSSSVDRPPTYLSDNTSTPSTTPSMTPSIKCEPIEHKCSSQHTSHMMSNNFNDNCVNDKNDSIERHSDRDRDRDRDREERNDRIHERHHKKHNNHSISSKLSLKEATDVEMKEQSLHKTITTTITASKTREKHSARVEPLIRSTDDTTDCVVLNGRRDVNTDFNEKNIQIKDNKHKRCEASPIKAVRITNSDESRDKDRINSDLIKDNKDLKSMNARVKRELIDSVECDMSLPSNTKTDSVPNCDATSDSNASDVIPNNTSESGPKPMDNSLVDNKLIDDNSQMDDKNLIIDDNSNSNSKESREEVIVSECQKNVDTKTSSNKNKESKDAKRESQLKQLQSYRKESHRLNGNKPSLNAIHSQPLNGIESSAAISIVLPKHKEQISGQPTEPSSLNLTNQSSNQSKESPIGAGCALNKVLDSTELKLTSASKPVTNSVQNRTQPKAQSVITCRTKPVPKISANNSGENPTQHQKQSLNVEKTAICPNPTNGHKLPQTTIANKPLPKKPRITQKTTSTSIPVGIAIAQQRTSPKTKSPNDSNASQPLKPILPTLSLPVMANSPILITDSPPAGTSLWIKPTSNSSIANNNSLQTNSQFSLTGDYQLARDSLTGHLYLIRNSSSLPTTPTTTPKPQTIIPPLSIKSNEHQSKSSPSAIITLPVGATQPQQFFASLGQTQASTLILDTTNRSPLVQIAATAPVTNLTTTNAVKCVHHLDSKEISSSKTTETIKSLVNVERGCQASISDDELTCDNMKTTATQVDMDSIHSSEEDDDNEGKRYKLRIFGERKDKSCEKGSSVGDDDESSRDSVHLQIVDELAADEPPQLHVKSANVMQFIDHHGLDLLVDSIEEFAAREEPPPSADLPVNGLQLLSTLAEQRSREERSSTDGSALRRHSADSHTTANGLNSSNQSTQELNSHKRRQRSESCFTTNPIKFDGNEELLSDIKKLMKTSGCQTDDRSSGRFGNSFLNVRRSERIFINDSVVSNVKDVTTEVNKDRDLLPVKELKRKDGSENKIKFVSNDSKVISSEKNVSNSEQSVRAKPKDQYVFTDTKSDDLVPNLTKFSIINNKTKTNDSLVFCDIKPNNQKIGSDLTTDQKKEENSDHQKIVIKKKKKKLLSTAGSLEKSSSEGNNNEKRVKKRKNKPSEEDNKKKLKTDYDKQIDDSIETIIKRVSQIDESIDESLIESQTNDSIDKEKKIISDDIINTNESKVCDEHKDITKKKRPLVKTSFELYDQKRMKLLDETIDEIIAKELVSIEELQRFETSEEIIDSIEPNPETTESEPSLSESLVTTLPSPPQESEELVVPPKPVSIEQEPKSKALVKQSSVCSSDSVSSSASSISESCHSVTSSLNLKLSESDLDLKLNVIMLVDGLLFIGEICPIQPPDIYGIVLHGERQHRPIIYSQEEMLREAIREVKPSLEDLEEGQRVCAYWSTQYRHLYAGYVRSSSPHPNLVFVEFDDGDNGRIAIDDIRLLPQDYPQMKINADPLKNLERKRRMSSCGKDNRKNNSDISSDNKIEEKKSFSEEMSKTFKNKSIEESKPYFIKDSNKRDKNLKNKYNKSCNTSSDKTIPSHESSADRLSSKSDSKKKKKKHNKEDRHHRHHHNHKHHHCRHHRKCKKRKKSKEENNSSTGSSPHTLLNDSNERNDKNEDKIDKSFENKTKTIKLVAIKSTPKESKSSEDSIDAQNGSVDNHSDNKTTISSNSIDSKDNINRTPLKTVIKKTPKQRALDRLQTNLSESFLTITSPVRKRYTNENKDNPVTSPTPKKRERMPSAEKSKIAAFLPERQLWHWSGKYIRRTGNKGSRTRKVYYREIERGREHIRVDDCAVFLSTGRPNLPYIGRIDSMWQTGSGTMIVKVRWFYHPEETKGQPVPLLDKRGALFESSHFDVNDVQTISHKCQVISWTEYQEKRRENPLVGYDDPPNVYYLAGRYDALAGYVDMDSTVPLKDNKSKDQISDKSEKSEKTEAKTSA